MVLLYYTSAVVPLPHNIRYSPLPTIRDFPIVELAMSEEYLNTAAKAASYNVLLQLLMRTSTFILNGFILRFIQAELLGVVNLR